MKRSIALSLTLFSAALFAPGAWAQADPAAERQAQREQRRAELRAAVRAQRQERLAASDKKLTPAERAELREQLGRQPRVAPGPRH